MTHPTTRRRTRVITDRVGVASVQSEVRQSGQVVDEQGRDETFNVRTNNHSGSQLHVAEVEVDGSLTHNLGNYNSARVSVRVSIPVGMPLFTSEGYSDAELEVLNRAYHQARDKVDEYIAEESRNVLDSQS